MNTQSRPVRLPSQNYLGFMAYFVTICCHQRRPLFRDLDLGKWIISTLIDSAARHNFRLLAYCAMPDHLHFLTHGRSTTSNLMQFVSSFKQQSGYLYQKQARQRLWQPRYFEHILRSSDDFAPIAFYIWNNPVRKNLCFNSADYPLSGSLTTTWKSSCPSNREWTPPWQDKIAARKPNDSES